MTNQTKAKPVDVESLVKEAEKAENTPVDNSSALESARAEIKENQEKAAHRTFVTYLQSAESAVGNAVKILRDHRAKEEILKRKIALHAANKAEFERTADSLKWDDNQYTINDARTDSRLKALEEQFGL